MSDKLFLLGGYDLEMLEIKELLKSKNIAFKDKELKWGAKLSDYQNELNFSGTLYGIELEQDIEPPKNYIEIDHHGKNDHKKSSLEQVAEILGVGLDDDQMLIAANDTRYISGMKALCATKEEIDEIRARDRAFQGVTKEDEELALQSFNIALSDKSNVIYSKTSHFSAVSDLAFYKYDNYIIYNDSKIVFYRYKKSNILDFLSTQNVIESSYYYGGGDFGFVGIKEDILTKGEIKKLIDEFAKMKKDELYSYHTFMLPFRFDLSKQKIESKNKLYAEISLEDRIKISEKTKASLEKDGWCHKSFEINSNYDYNEYSYFYDFIRDSLYNQNSFQEEETSYYFEKEYSNGKFYLNAKERKFELDIEGISLRLFETGVGIFTIELANKKAEQSDIDAILKINDFGRRIYPQFLGRWDNDANWTQATKNSFLPTSIRITLPDQAEISEDFCKDYKEVPKSIKISDYIMTLLGKGTFTDSLENSAITYFIQPILDDRMFVLSWYGNNGFTSRLKNYKYVKDLKWYEYVFVDGNGITVHSNDMREKLIKNVTYDRWMDCKDGLTLFGLTRYSFVCLSENSDFTKNILPLPHMKTMYFQMFTLLLAVRASILRFSQEVTVISSNPDEANKISPLYKNYIKFVNKLYFREITAQEQGIELYNKACEIMRIHEDVKDLDDEIEELHTYSDIKAEQNRNEKLDVISKIGAVLLPPTLVAGLFGMNVLTFDTTTKNEALALVLIILSGFLGFVFADQDEMKSQENSKEASFWDKFKNKLSKFKKLLVFIFICLVVLFAFFIDRKKEDSQEVKITNEPTVILKENRDTK